MVDGDVEVGHILHHLKEKATGSSQPASKAWWTMSVVDGGVPQLTS